MFSDRARDKVNAVGALAVDWLAGGISPTA